MKELIAIEWIDASISVGEETYTQEEAEKDER